MALKGKNREDRRVRFARVEISPLDGGAVSSLKEDREMKLVTDSRGRLRYPLSAGQYRIRVAEDAEHRFEVRDGWASVNIQLPSA